MDLEQVFSSISQKVGKQPKIGDGFFAVKISSSAVSAAIWKVEEEKVTLGKITQSTIKSEKFEDLLSATDEVISAAFEPAANQDSKTEKVIFGLPFHWVIEGKIVEDKLALLRRLCLELDLKPLGYVLLSEALENYYKETEGAPLTAILLEFDNQEGFLTMYRAGKNLGTVVVNSKTEGINEELEKALKKFTQAEVLPSRIIIYDGNGDLEKIADKITAYPWTKNLPFLHFPRVEILPSDQVVRAVAVAGGMQMGGHFEMVKEKAPSGEQKIELVEVSAEEAGFLPETEFKEVEIPLTNQDDQPLKTPVLGRLQEIAAVPSTEPVSVANKVDLGETFTTIKRKVLVFAKNLFAKIKSFFKVGPRSRTTKVVPLLALLLVIILALFAMTIYSFPKATIFLKVSSPTFDKELTVTVVTEKSLKPATDSAKTITGSFVDVSEIGTKKGVATGRQLVGDKAKGNATIYSATTAKTFAAGTILISPTGLKFSLDHDIAVASGDAITRATATNTMTAADIGDSYNLPTGTKFTIGNLSSSQYAAQIDQALAGGNSHQATVVAKEDQSRLMATLSAELIQKAQGDLEAKLMPSQKLLPNAITSVVSKKKFSQDVGNEAETVSLDLTMDFSGIIFSQNDLITVFARNFSSSIPPGFILSPDRTNVNIDDIKIDKTGNTSLKVHMTANLLPKINVEEAIKSISGKSFSAASAYLSKIPGVGGLSIETNPKFFSPVVQLVLPWKKENIHLEIISQ